MRLTNREIEGRLGAWALRLVSRWMARKDILRAEVVGERLGRLAFHLSKKRRDRSLANLRLAMPELSEEERVRITKGVFEHFGRVMCDFLRGSTRSTDEVLSSITAEGLEHLDAALKAGNGAVLVTGHFGNWERMGNWLTLSGYGPMSVIARDANNPDMNEMILKIRKAAGLDVISRGNAARGTLTRLKRNEFVAILPDQNSDEVFIPFFGQPCGTVLGPAVLAQRAGAPMIPACCYREGPGKYRFVAREPLTAQPGYEGSPEGLMRSVNLYLEDVIREHPDQYLWIHDRWKATRKRGLV